MQQTTIDDAIRARDDALGRVSRNAGSYTDRALEQIRTIDGEFSGEDIRLLVESRIGKPHHHNAWGAIIRTAIKQGAIQRTGRMAQMNTRRSHARMTPTYYAGSARQSEARA